MLASPPGITNIPLPVDLFLWMLGVAVSPVVLAYLVFVIRELIRGPQPAEPPGDDERP